MQVVATKPIARWQIWLGKWLGIMSLNAALLAISGASVFGLLQYRATRLPPEEQRILRNEVLVARGSAMPAVHTQEIDEETERQLKEILSKTPVTAGDLPLLRTQIRERIKSAFQLAPAGATRPWQIDLGSVKDSLRDRPLYVRVKFNTANYSSSGTYIALWRVGQPGTTHYWDSEPMSLAPD